MANPLENAAVAHAGNEHVASQVDDDYRVDPEPSSSAMKNQEAISSLRAHSHMPPNMSQILAVGAPSMFGSSSSPTLVGTGIASTPEDICVDPRPSFSTMRNQEAISSLRAHSHMLPNMSQILAVGAPSMFGSSSSPTLVGTGIASTLEDIDGANVVQAGTVDGTLVASVTMVNPTNGVASYVIPGVEHGDTSHNSQARPPASFTGSEHADDFTDQDFAIKSLASDPTTYDTRDELIESKNNPTSTSNSDFSLNSPPPSTPGSSSEGFYAVSSYESSHSPSPSPSPSPMGAGMGSEVHSVQPSNSPTPTGSFMVAVPVQDSLLDALEPEISPALQSSQGMNNIGSGASLQGRSSKRLNETSSQGGPQVKKSKYSGSFDGIIIPEITDDMTPAEKHLIKGMRNRLSAKRSRERLNKQKLELEQYLYEARKENPKLMKWFFGTKELLVKIIKYVEDNYPPARAKEMRKPFAEILSDMDQLYASDPYTFNHPGTNLIPFKYVGKTVKPRCEK